MHSLPALCVARLLFTATAQGTSQQKPLAEVLSGDTVVRQAVHFARVGRVTIGKFSVDSPRVCSHLHSWKAIVGAMTLSLAMAPATAQRHIRLSG